MSQLITLTQGYFAIVDDEDFDFINSIKWHYRNEGYAATTAAGKNITMHRFLLDAKPGECVDHLNRNGLDNRRCNIRIATYSQNQWNRGLACNNTTGFKGVCTTHNGRFRAHLKVNRKDYHLGTFATAEEAACLYDVAVVEYHGAFAVTNKMLGLLPKTIL